MEEISKIINKLQFRPQTKKGITFMLLILLITFLLLIQLTWSQFLGAPSLFLWEWSLPVVVNNLVLSIATLLLTANILTLIDFVKYHWINNKSFSIKKIEEFRNVLILGIAIFSFVFIIGFEWYKHVRTTTIYIVGNSSDQLDQIIEKFNSIKPEKRDYIIVERIPDDWSRYDTDEKFDKAENYLSPSNYPLKDYFINNKKHFQGFIESNEFEKIEDKIKINNYHKPSGIKIDLIELDCIWMQYFIEKGLLYRLNDLDSFDINPFYPKIMLYAKDSKGTYGIPHFVDVGIFYYHKNLINLDSINDNNCPLDSIFLRISNSLQINNLHEGFVFPSNKYEGLNCSFIDLLSLNGYNITTRNNLIKSNFYNDPRVIETLSLIHRSIYKNQIIPLSTLSYKEDQSKNVFTDGYAMFHRNWPYVWWQDKNDNMEIYVNDNLSTVLGGWFFGISRYSEYPEAAWKFIQFASSSEIQKEYYLENRFQRLPSRIFNKISEDKKRQKEYEIFKKAILNSQLRPIDPNYKEFSKELMNAIYECLREPEFNKEDLIYNMRRAQETLNN